MKNISLYLFDDVSLGKYANSDKFYTPLLLPHLLKSVGDVKRTNFFIILKLEELIPSVTCHIDEYVRTRIR